MKNFLLYILFVCLVASETKAQELPIFSQKFNNGLIYNPSQAGLYGGAVDLSYQNQWSGLDRSITNLYAGIQNHFAGGRVGVAANVFREKFNLLGTNFVSGAVAYHLPLGNNSGLSMGVSAEYANVNLDLSDAKIAQESDPLILNFPGYNHVDFNFGFTLTLQQFQLGASSVRFTNMLTSEETPEKDYFPTMFTGSASYRLLFMDDGTWLEPRVNYRYIDNHTDIFDAGLYFTYRNLITAGASYRTNSTITAGVGVHLQNFTIAYSRQSLSNEYSSDLGGTDEISLRFTFNENLNFYGAAGAGRRGAGALGGTRYNNSSNKLMNRTTSKPKRNLSDLKERRKMRHYKGKYKKLIKRKKNN
ncbi:PorP/SprF family type IX secretion system membrane protein [Chondrinema litorale]|uniref:PorP/SprF family type IX secretion system membrane protein n=1 Tax=Chondrinema litorale TaxID=2994555 RepID=UPI0025437CA1|nr:PorP/SprF family type IX secretion system membrane protein [Chondrinema litorale]UZR92594.1 PorP/SprF family type IX secretion system membrane protein [Chondrinema litorale]